MDNWKHGHYKRGELAKSEIDRQEIGNSEEENKESKEYLAAKEYAKKLVSAKEQKLGRELTDEEKRELFRKTKGEILKQYSKWIKDLFSPEEN